MRKLFFIFLSGLFVSALSAADMVVRVSEEDAGSNCANGGMKIEVGTDDNGNEELDDDEVVAAKTQYVCNGADGSDGTVRLVSVTEEPEDGMCSPVKGVKIEVGVDTNGNGTLESGEVTTTSYVCNGADGKNALSKTSEEPAGDNCVNGGIKIEVGVDTNGNGTLDANEVSPSATKYVCNGADGEDGKDALAKISEEPKGENCQKSTGIKIEIGIDANGNGELDENEVADTQYICNGKNGSPGQQGESGEQGEPGKNGTDGAPGAPGEKGDQGLKGDQGVQGETGATGEAGKDGSASLVSVVDEPKGKNCASGGKKIEVGIDANGNGTLDEDEIDSESVYYVCNGRDAEEAGLSSSSGCAMTAIDGEYDWIYAVFVIIFAFCAFFKIELSRR